MKRTSIKEFVKYEKENSKKLWEYYDKLNNINEKEENFIKRLKTGIEDLDEEFDFYEKNYPETEKEYNDEREKLKSEYEGSLDMYKSEICCVLETKEDVEEYFKTAYSDMPEKGDIMIKSYQEMLEEYRGKKVKDLHGEGYKGIFESIVVFFDDIYYLIKDKNGIEHLCFGIKEI